MPKLTVIENGHTKYIEFDGKALLSDLLQENGIEVAHPCAGRGVCKKCTVYIDSKPYLSCKYIVERDTVVYVRQSGEMVSVTGTNESGEVTQNVCLCLDIGTTTLALALVSLDSGLVIKTYTAKNPQSVFGADVISRIDYCTKNGVSALKDSIVTRVNALIADAFKDYSIDRVGLLYVAGNTTMLHLFFGVDCSAMGVSPYTPTFLEMKRERGASVGIDGVDEVIALPGISAFVGADIVAGLNYIGRPPKGKYNLLIDLGTNAEIALYSDSRVYCTTAAAGPCFEGANISCGMAAMDGAICSYNDGIYSVIGDSQPKGLCATGLIDLIADLVKKEIIDESGYIDDDKFTVAQGVDLADSDIREFQLAKSAVLSAVMTLFKLCDVDIQLVDKMYVAGGFSAQMNVENASFVGLLPSELKDRFTPVNNSSLLGTIDFALGKRDTDFYCDNAEYIDISSSPVFTELFFENMHF